MFKYIDNFYHKKLDKFDEKIISEIKDMNFFLAGGALTSLFTDDPIKDYDIFCQTKDEVDYLMTKLIIYICQNIDTNGTH